LDDLRFPIDKFSYDGGMTVAHRTGPGVPRRQFVGALAAISASLLQGRWPEIVEAATQASRAGTLRQPLAVLSPADAAALEAITGLILPSDDGPGAREAQVVRFIDRALETFDRDRRLVYEEGLRQLRADVARLRPGASSFAALASEEQLALLRTIEEDEFFLQVRVHTLMGFLGNPEYGGNPDGIGWRYVGFEDRFVWGPPFGYYDRQGWDGR